MSYDNPWLYKGKPVEEIPEGAESFVYILRHRETGKSYLGKKLFWFAKTKQVKGKKKKVKAESDWKTYYSSSEEIKKMVEAGEVFDREIRHFCTSKGSVNYWELREQMDARVLENPDIWYNGIVNARIHRTHVKPTIQPW